MGHRVDLHQSAISGSGSIGPLIPILRGSNLMYPSREKLTYQRSARRWKLQFVNETGALQQYTQATAPRSFLILESTVTHSYVHTLGFR